MFNIQLTDKQVEIVDLIAFGEHKRVVISCMTRYGKSFSVAIGVCLWILINEKKKIAIVAPTNEKTTIVRNYIASIVVRSQLMLNLLDIDRKGSTRIQKEVSKRRMTWKNGVEMRTLSAEGKGEQLMGFGADLLILDESCDIEYEVFRSKVSRMLGDSPNSRIIEIGNPLHRDNHMWEHWTDPNWFKIHIGWEIALNEGRITIEFLNEQRSQLTDREFQILYKAEFPETSEDALIDWKWIEHAYKTPMEIEGTIIMGADIAEQGNDWTVVTIAIKDNLNRYKVIDVQSWGKTDLMPTVGKIMPLINKYKPKRINIDATGVGSGVYSRLEELKAEGRLDATINAFKGGMSPDQEENKERFLNIKAESYWHTRKLFEENKISIPQNRELISQLSKMKWELTSSEKIRIRDPGTKEGDTSEEKSPDFSDSLNICLWEGSKSPLAWQVLNLAKK
jgi:hypothetical protein